MGHICQDYGGYQAMSEAPFSPELPSTALIPKIWASAVFTYAISISNQLTLYHLYQLKREISHDVQGLH